MMLCNNTEMEFPQRGPSNEPSLVQLDNPPHSGTSSVLSLSGTSKFSGSVDTSGLNVALVAPDILISDRVVAESEADLRRMGVTHIVTIDTYPLTHGDRPAGERLL